MESSFITREESIQELMAVSSHTHSTYTHLSTYTHTRHKKTPQASTPLHVRQIPIHPFDDKTAYSTPHYSQRMAFTQEEKFQRTLAVKQQQQPSVRVLLWEEAATENTDFMILVKRLHKEAVQSWISGG